MNPFFSIRVFFHGHWQLTRQQGKGGDQFLFHSTTPPVHEHSDIYLQLFMWDNYHIFFNCTACIYQTATRWDLPPYRTTIWLIDDLMLIFVLVLQASWLTKCKKIKPKHWTKGKIGVAAQSWRWLWVELMAWEPSQWGSTPTQASFL